MESAVGHASNQCVPQPLNAVFNKADQHPKRRNSMSKLNAGNVWPAKFRRQSQHFQTERSSTSFFVGRVPHPHLGMARKRPRHHKFQNEIHALACAALRTLPL